MLQRVIGVYRLLLLNLLGDGITHFAKRLHFFRLDVVQTYDQIAHRGLHCTGKLAFFGQVCLFQLVCRGVRLQPAQLATGTA
ncbi:hypothetical protein D3C86_1944780 [compost metagenome]